MLIANYHFPCESDVLYPCIEVSLYLRYEEIESMITDAEPFKKLEALKARAGKVYTTR